MSTNLDGIVAKIRSVRSQKRPELEKKKDRLEALLAALQGTRGKASTVAAQYPDLAVAMQRISFDGAENQVNKAIAACKTALTRLRRESINIGVAGKARQGKSQILQMLTGLNDQQIPTGDGGFCTAARNAVSNGSPQSATVFYLTETDLLAQKVWPSYDPVGANDVALGLSPRPGSIAAFIQSTLPDVPDTASVNALQNWEKVKTLQRDLRNNPVLVGKLGIGKESVPLDSVRKYLVKDNDETDYQVVDHVEIVTPFEMGLPQGMTVYDLPGLQDPTLGIRETMLRSVAEDADIVLLLRMPNNTGDDWDVNDINTMNDLKGIYPADVIQPKDWIQLVLNLDKRPESHNEKNVERMKATAPNGFTPVVCDCGSKEAVRQMVDENIDALVKQAGRIDDLRIREAEVAFAAAIGEARSLYGALRNASGDVIAQKSGFDFERHLLSFMAGLRDPFKKDLSPEFREAVREILAQHFKKAEKKFAVIYKENDAAADFPPELPVFSRSRLTEEFGASDGPDGVVEKTVRNQREAVLKLLRDQLTECCGELVARYFDCVVAAGFAPNPSLNRVASVSDGRGSSREWLERFLSAIRANGTFDGLESAMQGLLHFGLTFDGTILPAIYSIADLDDFNPDRSFEDREEGSRELDDVKAYLRDKLHDSGKRAEAFYNWLRQKSESILSCVTSESPSSPLFQIAEHVTNTMRSNYDAFVFRFIWGDPTTNEWRRFADRNKAIFWKEEFDKASANSQLAKDWNAALAALAASF